MSQRFTAKTNLARVPFSFSNLQLLADIKINGAYALTVMIDTGNDAELMLNDSVIEKLGLGEAAAKGKEGKFGGLGGVAQTKTFNVPLVELGSLRLQNVQVVVVPGDFPPSLGSGILGRYKTTFDFQRNCIWIDWGIGKGP